MQNSVPQLSFSTTFILDKLNTVKAHLFSSLDTGTDGAFCPNSASISSVFLYIFWKLTHTQANRAVPPVVMEGSVSGAANRSGETRPQNKKKKI